LYYRDLGGFLLPLHRGVDSTLLCLLFIISLGHNFLVNRRRLYRNCVNRHDVYAKVRVPVRIVPSLPLNLKVSKVLLVASITRSPLAVGVTLAAGRCTMGRVNVILVPSSIIPLSPTTVAPVATRTRFTVRSAMNDVPRASGDNRTVGGQETNRGGTRRTDRTGYAPRSGRTGRSSGADRTCRSGRANPANRTGRTDRTDGPLGAYRTGGTGRAGGADRALNRT